MSELAITIAQFIITIWPLIILTVLIYSFLEEPGRRSPRGWLRTLALRLAALGDRMRRGLSVTWTILFLFWLVTLFAENPTPSLVPEPWNTGVFLGGFALLVGWQISRLSPVPGRLRARIDLHRARAIQDLKELDPYAFELLVSETYRAYGFQARHVGRSGDHGVDVELKAPNGDLWVVQCKRYRDTVGESTLRDLYGTMMSEQADHAALVTTADITQPARAWAQGKPIDLIDGPELLRFIDNARLRDEGTPMDRLAHWLDGLFASRSLPPRGLRKQVSVEHLPPVKIQYQQGVPICPRCGVLMNEHQNTRLRSLYRCRNYPICRVVLEGE